MIVTFMQNLCRKLTLERELPTKRQEIFLELVATRPFRWNQPRKMAASPPSRGGRGIEASTGGHERQVLVSSPAAGISARLEKTCATTSTPACSLTSTIWYCRASTNKQLLSSTAFASGSFVDIKRRGPDACLDSFCERSAGALIRQQAQL